MILFLPSLIEMWKVLLFLLVISAKNFLSSISIPSFRSVMCALVMTGSVLNW